jgi:tRNA (adenine57-N1/adenine58-N1)-methyltransferase
LVWNLHGKLAEDGDLAELVGLKHKHFIIQLKSGSVFQSHKGTIQHDDIIGKSWGSQIFSHLGSPFFVLQPPLGDLLRGLPRTSQIMYPKEIGFILINMGIGPGQNVIEAGTGSGSFTTALAYAVGPGGHVTTYEVRPQMQQMAQKNLERFGLSERVTFKLQDIQDGFDETGADALFLDVPNPYDYIEKVRQALKPGGFFGALLPTANQVIRLLTSLHQNHFAFIDVCEVMQRFYQADPMRFRPVDRMIAHTGFLIFGRPVIISPDSLVDEEFYSASNQIEILS